MRDKIFYALSFGFLSGVLWRSFVLVNFYTAVFIGVMALSIILFFILISKNKWGIIFGAFILLFSLGILRFHSADQPSPKILEDILGRTALFSGIVVDQPDKKGDDQQKLTVEISNWTNQNNRTDSSGGIKILLSAPLGDFRYGDEIKFSGRLDKPENFLTDQGKVFDYINYLRQDGIFYTMKNPQPEIVSRGHGNLILSSLFDFKEKFLANLYRNIPRDEGILSAGLVLGERSAFNPEMRNDFIRTGIIHIVVLSGYHLAVVADNIMRLLTFFLPLSFSIGLAIVVIILFALVAGSPATAVRAAIMAILALVARATGRTKDIGRVLVFTVGVMTLWNPWVLGFNISFQLSLIATVGIIYIAPRLEKFFKWIPFVKLQKISATTTAAYFFVLPFILYNMGNLSLAAIPVNLLVLPFLPYTMFFIFAAGMVGFLGPAVAFLPSLIADYFLAYLLFIVRSFSSISFASFSIPDFPLIITILIYVHFAYYFFGSDIALFFKKIE